MQILRPTFNLDRFFERLQGASTRVLMLDYDGTLAPFHVDPAQARPWPGLPPLLDEIIASGQTRLVIVSGRWIKSLLPLLSLHETPEIFGSYGWEHHRADGYYVAVPLQTEAAQALAIVESWRDELQSHGARCERKPASVAIHWRGLSNAQIVAIRAQIFEKWRSAALEQELAWHDFDGGIEFRIPGRNKGEVVRSIVDQSGSQAVCAFLGDDVEDETAFKVMPDTGLSVLVRAQFRPTAADLWLQAPEELFAFLRRWIQASKG